MSSATTISQSSRATIAPDRVRARIRNDSENGYKAKRDAESEFGGLMSEVVGIFRRAFVRCPKNKIDLHDTSLWLSGGIIPNNGDTLYATKPGRSCVAIM